MKWWLLAIGVGLSAGSAYAASPLSNVIAGSPVERPHLGRSFDLRLVQPPVASHSPIRQSGMIAETGVAPNMQLGIGLFSVRHSRLNSLEPRSDLRTKPRRKLGLSFNWRF